MALETLSVQVPEKTVAEVDAFAKAHGLSRDDFINEAIENHLFAKRFRELREQAIAEIEKHKPGGYTEEEIYRIVS